MFALMEGLCRWSDPVPDASGQVGGFGAYPQPMTSSASLSGNVACIFRHPVKGLTPEPLGVVELAAGAYFPNDRAYAVEVGPSGFDPAAPRHISKMKFAVLARFPELARLKTRLDDARGVFHIGDAHGFGVEVKLGEEGGRAALAKFLQAFIGETDAELKVLAAPDGHRFMDNSTMGMVSVINLASVRAVEAAIGREVDPLRFRANIYVEGWEPWAEDGLAKGDRLSIGGAVVQVNKLIDRCVATHVNLDTGERDIDMVGELRERFGRITLGTYVGVVEGGRVGVGDAVGRV
jgi:uncharacterized protein YcbX